MTIYVAGSSKQLDRARNAIEALRNAGHIVTHDWVEQVDLVGDANPPDASDEQRCVWAWDDLDGVRNADVALFLLPSDHASFGMGVEFGYAVRHREVRPELRIMTAGCTDSIFAALADACFDTDGQAIDSLGEEPFCDCKKCGGGW